MKILFVADVPRAPNSGAAGTEFQTIQALRDLGHDVDEIWADDLTRRIKHPNLHSLLELPIAFRNAIARKCRNQNYQVIHANQPFAYLAAKDHLRLGRQGVFVNRSHGFEMAMHEHLTLWYRRMGMRERKFPNALFGRMVDYGITRSCRLIAQYADGFIVSSSVDQAFLINRLNVQPHRVACIPQAPPPSFQSDILPRCVNGCRRLLVVGPVRFSKGVHILFEAWNRLALDYPELSLTWVCSANEWHEAKLRLSTAASDRTDFVEPVSQEGLMDIYDQHDIFLFPSLYEGFGKAPLEAMARGLCVVASDTGGMRDIISSGDDGILNEVGNANQLVQAVVCLHLDVEKAMQMGLLARETASRYSWSRVARETMAFYEQLISIK